MSGGVPEEYAARTVCWSHLKKCPKSLEEITGESDSLRGKFLGKFYSDCEGKPVHDKDCKYSHTIFNTKKILRLVGSIYAFCPINPTYMGQRARILLCSSTTDMDSSDTACDGWTDGWDVTVNGINYGSNGYDEKTYNLPKSLLLAEHRLGIKTFNFKEETDGKVQSICRSNNDRGFCKFKTECRYDHDLIDSKRLERLVRWADEGMSPNRDYMTVECRVEGDQAPTWKITLKPDAFAKVRRGSRRVEETYQDKDLLKVVRHMERVVRSLKFSSPLRRQVDKLPAQN